MAMKQGRCPNCGSLLMVNDTDAKSVCMFCNARFSPIRAIQIDQNPADVEFPNEPQDELTDEERQIAFSAVRSVQVTAPVRSQPAPRKKKKLEPGRLTPQEKVALQKRDLIEPLVSKEHKTKLFIGIGAVVILMAAVFLPLTLNRVNKQNELVARMDEIAVFEVPGDEYYNINGFRNTELLLVSPVDVSESDVNTVMNNYKAVRADIYGLDASDNQNNVKVRIAASNGNFTSNGSN